MILGKLHTANTVKQLASLGPALSGGLASARERIMRDIADASSTRAASLGGVHAHTADAILPVGTRIDLDYSKHPAIGGATFGGGGRPATRQFPPWKRGGYTLFPTIAERGQAIIEEHYGKELDDQLDD